MKIIITNEQCIKVSIQRLRSLVKYVLAHEGLKKVRVEISILLVDNKRIKELNNEYLGRKRATDVISFRMWEGPFYKLHPELLGDVVVSVEQAKEQAHRLHRDIRKEIWLYIIHGLLHLLGYEDDTKANAVKMNKRSMDILNRWEEYVRKN